MRKILLLGGSIQQIPAIEYSKDQGYYTVLCDYLSNNQGQYYADKFYCISTTDKEAILEVAKEEKVDGIVAYASDPAAPTAAYVAEKLNLPTNPYKSIEILAYKNKFREFLKNNNFNCPYAENFKTYEQVLKSIIKFRFPVMVKPVDSSGSKGVRQVCSIDGLETAFNVALKYSRNKNVIIEEFIKREHKYMVGGDCFVLNGKVVFWGLLNCHRDSRVNTLVPVGKSYPVQINDEKIQEIHTTIQKIVDILNIKFGGFNLEIMFDKHNKLYLIEMGPRNGGNMIPDLLNIITGVNMVRATVETAMGNYNLKFDYVRKKLYFATYNLHSHKNGIFKGILFNKEIEEKIIKKVIYKRNGDPVQYFDGADKAIGIVFFKFDSKEQMIEMMDYPNNWINMIVK